MYLYVNVCVACINACEYLYGIYCMCSHLCFIYCEYVRIYVLYESVYLCIIYRYCMLIDVCVYVMYAMC